jgi:hypothetical protein
VDVADGAERQHLALFLSGELVAACDDELGRELERR